MTTPFSARSESVPTFKHSAAQNDQSPPSLARSVSSESWKKTWIGALEKAKVIKDPWEAYDIPSFNEEKAIRYRYKALEKTWDEDTILVKMMSKPFGRGAMRECYRLKKLSTFSGSHDWNHASNYVAKRYIEDVADKVYFDDVKLQMDAKVWAQEFNLKNPPKKVDIFQLCAIRMIEREGAPIFHLEHFIEGKYVKYNSNSGFVLSDETLRMTPQAFSHFTFERSGHQLIVVDIQGVGDLYTDPQIHTAVGAEYGDGNLGPKGMALFFSTHFCNEICDELGLTPFDMSAKEISRMEDVLKRCRHDSETKIKDSNEQRGRRVSAAFGLVQRLSSTDSSVSPPFSPFSEEDMSSCSTPQDTIHIMRKDSDSSPQSSPAVRNGFQLYNNRLSGRDSYLKASAPLMTLSEDEIHEKLIKVEELQKQETSVLGEVHVAMALYCEMGRFTENQPDLDAALFHLQKAGQCGNLEANKNLAKIYMQQPHEILEGVTIEAREENFENGMNYLLAAASCGDKESIVNAARAYDSGDGLGSTRQRSWRDAVRWYETALEYLEADEGGLDAYPKYQILARLAEMFREGGNGLTKDPNKAGELYTEAAEAAMSAMKGKLANKFYMLAEEAWGEVEDE